MAVTTANFSAVQALRAQGTPATPAPSVPTAMGHFYSGDVAGAAKILERVTAASPANTNAWRMLALCYRTTGNLDGARGAYGKSLALEPGARAR